MGQFLATFRSNSYQVQEVPEIDFDISNATPSIEESEKYDELFKLLVEPNDRLLKLFNEYKPASDFIREAIISPIEENQNKAWEAVIPTVDMLKQFYDYSCELERGIPVLLDMLCKDSSTAKQLDKHPGVTKLFTNILVFVFEFDLQKIQYPAIQNDFSFYRRTLQRESKSTMINENDIINRISLFIAYPTPMLKCVIDTITTYTEAHQLQKVTCEWLSSIWALCFQNINKKQDSIYFLKLMVLVIILYDHIDPLGAYIRTSPIQAMNSIKTIQLMNNNLISTLKYNSKHLNDDTTPKAIKNLILTT